MDSETYGIACNHSELGRIVLHAVLPPFRPNPERTVPVGNDPGLQDGGFAVVAIDADPNVNGFRLAQAAELGNNNGPLDKIPACSLRAFLNGPRPVRRREIPPVACRDGAAVRALERRSEGARERRKRGK